MAKGKVKLVTFDEWFFHFTSWGLTYHQFLTFSLREGNDPGDVVWTSSEGHILTRHVANHWVEFYSASSAGWNAAIENNATKGSERT